MKQRDYKREYELAKQRGETKKYKFVGAHVLPEVSEKFKEIAAENGTRPGTLIKEWIEDYIRNNQGLITIPKKFGTMLHSNS